MKKTTGFLFFIVAIFVFVYSCVIVPYSIEHGYYVTVAKFLSTGCIPWKEINLMDSPIGLYIMSLPYVFMGNAHTGIYAQWVVVIFHILNIAILFSLLKKLNHNIEIILYSLSFYLFVVLSFCGMNVNLEPFACTFLLVSLLCISYTKKAFLIVSGVCFAFAIGCKVQMLFLLPAFFAYSVIMAKKEKRDNLYLFLTILITFLIMCCFFTFVSNGTTWLKDIVFSIHPSNLLFKDIFINTCIIGLKCFSFLVIPVIFILLEKNNIKISSIYPALFAYLGILCLLGFGYDKSWGQLCLPFAILAYSFCFQRGKTKSESVMLILFLLIPAAFATREFFKLDFGKEKTEQMEKLERIYHNIAGIEDIHVINYKTPEYGIGAQLFSEKDLKPYNISKTRYGFVDWRKPVDVTEEAKNTPILVIPSTVYFGLGTFREDFNHEPWVEEFVEYLVHIQATGNLFNTVLYKNGIPEEYYQEKLEDVHFESEEEHHNHHHHHEGEE